MASLGSNKELEDTTGTGKSQRTSLIFNLDNKEDFTLCSLTSEKIEQQSLDLVLTEGETIAFRVEGPHSIHLSGYYINEDEEHDDFINDEDEDEIYSDEAEEDSQIEYDSELEDEDFTGSESEISEVETRSKKNPRIRVLESDEEEDEEENSEFDSEEDEEMDSEEDEEMDTEEEESEEEVPVKDTKKAKVDVSEAKKTKEPVKEVVKESPKPAAPAKVTPPPAKAAPAPAAATPASKPASHQAKEQGPAPVKKTLPSGLQIEDLKLGSGPKVSQGKKVLIHYKGSLLNGNVFDSSFGGKPLKFSVGKGEVIKGMDIGIVGMAVGGSRKLVIPGPLAYGNQSLPKIPRNSTLVFEIRLEKIL